MEKKKISLVVGTVQNLRVLAQFYALSQQHMVTAHIFESHSLDQIKGFSGDIRIYPEISEMPGYIRGLEEHLRDADFIIAFEGSSLSSFQACRVADKNGIPFAVYSSEWQLGLYRNAPNIRAIQYDVFLRSKLVLCNDRLCYRYLEEHRVPKERIVYAPYAVDRSLFCVSESRRQKFRKYVGFSDSDVILLLEGEISADCGARTALTILKNLRVRVSEADARRTKLLIVGDGPLARELKYEAAAEGLGAVVAFLNQETHPFLSDLYNAVDIALYPAHEEVNRVDYPPYRLLEQASCGVIPIVVKGTAAAAVASGLGLELSASDADRFADALQSLIVDPNAMKKLRAICAAADSTESLGQYIETVLASLLPGNSNRNNQRLSYSEELPRIDGLISQGRLDDAMIDLERLSLIVRPTAVQKSDVLRLKGDVYYHRAEMERAMEFYHESLLEDPSNVRSYKGLGFVAWRSYSNEEAVSFFRRALALDSSDPQIMLGLGLVHQRVGLPDQAMYWLEKAITIDGGQKAALAALVQVCSEIHRPAVAVECIKRVMETIGERRSLLMALGNLYIRTGKVAEGRGLLARALASDAA